MALHFNCPFCGHSQAFDEAPAGGFTVCPACDETLPESYQASETPPAESGAPAEDDEFLEKPPTPEAMPTITGGEESLPQLHENKPRVWLWLLLALFVLLLVGGWVVNLLVF